VGLLFSTPLDAQTYSISSSDASSDASSAGCNTGIAEAITSMQAMNVDSAEQLAHTMIPFNTTTTSVQTCLPSLMNLGINGLFTIPSLSQIESQLEQAVCSVVDSYESRLQSDVSPLYNQLSSDMGSGDVNLGTVGGVNLGAIPAGVQVTSGGSGLTTNIGEAFKNGLSDTQQVYNSSGLF